MSEADMSGRRAEARLMRQKKILETASASTDVVVPKASSDLPKKPRKIRSEVQSQRNSIEKIEEDVQLKTEKKKKKEDRTVYPEMSLANIFLIELNTSTESLKSEKKERKHKKRDETLSTPETPRTEGSERKVKKEKKEKKEKKQKKEKKKTEMDEPPSPIATDVPNPEPTPEPLPEITVSTISETRKDSDGSQRRYSSEGSELVK